MQTSTPVTFTPLGTFAFIYYPIILLFLIIGGITAVTAGIVKLTKN